MRLDIFSQEESDNNFINDFLKELKKAMKSKENYLTSEEQRLYSRQEFDVYEKLENNYYVLHDIYNDNERFKLKQCKNGQEMLIVVHKNDLDVEYIQKGDILKKEDNKYILDEEKTTEIRDTLENIKNEIIKSRK